MGDGVTTGVDLSAADGFIDSDGFAGVDDLRADGFADGTASFEAVGFNEGVGATDDVGVNEGVGATDGVGFAEGVTASMPPGSVAMRGLGFSCRGCGLAFEGGGASPAVGASPMANVRLAKTLPLVASSGGCFGELAAGLPAGRAVRNTGDFAGVDRSDPILS